MHALAIISLSITQGVAYGPDESSPENQTLPSNLGKGKYVAKQFRSMGEPLKRLHVADSLGETKRLTRI